MPLEENRPSRDPVAPAQSSASAQAKKKSKRNAAGYEVHSLQTLLAALASRSRNTCTISLENSTNQFRQITDADPLQAEALRLLGL